MVDGAWIHVSGRTGFDHARGRASDDAAEQAEHCFQNIQAAARAGFGPAALGRVRSHIAGAPLFPRLAPVFARKLGDVRPAAACPVTGMIDPRIRIEIEVTAHRAERR